MLEPISEVADKAISHLRKQSRLEDHVATKSFFQAYALDAICKYVFGIDTNAHENPNHQLIKNGRGVNQGFLLTNWLETLVTMLFYFFPRIESVSKTAYYSLKIGVYICSPLGRGGDFFEIRCEGVKNSDHVYQYLRVT